MKLWVCQPPDWDISPLQSTRISSTACFARLKIRRSTTFCVPVLSTLYDNVCCANMECEMYQKHWVAAESGESWSTLRCSASPELRFIFRSLTNNEYFMLLWISNYWAKLPLGLQLCLVGEPCKYYHIHVNGSYHSLKKGKSHSRWQHKCKKDYKHISL